MILIINVCSNKLHYNEFVRPIINILKENNFKYKVASYLDLREKDIPSFDKIIICGTALLDNNYIKHIHKFKWIKNTSKPIFGICAGAQIIALVFGGNITDELQIGLINKLQITKKDIIFDNVNLNSYYTLHNHGINNSEDYEILAKDSQGRIQIIKKNNTYGCLFHCEVRQKEMILNFCR